MFPEPNYAVTAKKDGENGLFHFGPFESESEAQEFADQLIGTPGWSLDEVPVLNEPQTLIAGTAIR